MSALCSQVIRFAFFFFFLFFLHFFSLPTTITIATLQLSVTAKLPTGSDYSLELDLAQKIDPTGSIYNVMGTKIEIKLKKAIVGLKWATLESDDVRSQPEAKPQYPSSSKKEHNWDSLEKTVKKEEEEEKPEGDAGLNKVNPNCLVGALSKVTNFLSGEM